MVVRWGLSVVTKKNLSNITNTGIALHYPLQTIQNLVYHALPPSQFFLIKDDAAAALLWHKVNRAADRMSSDILQQACCAKNKKEKRTLIHSCQVASIAMANRLHGYGKMVRALPMQEPAREQQVTAYYSLRDKIMNNLCLFDQFPGYCDKDLPLPDHIYEIEKKSIADSLLNMEDEWRDKIEPRLLDILVQPLYNFTALSSSNPSYSTHEYLLLLCNKTRSLYLACPAEANTALIYLLIHLNYNHDDFISYAVGQLQPTLSEEGIQGDLLAYIHLLHTLKRVRPLSAALYPGQPGCLAGIIDCIEQEIQLLEKQLAWQINTFPDVKTIEKNTLKSLQTCLSLSQLGLFLRLLHNTGLLTCEPLTYLFEQVSCHVHTARAAKYTAASLNSKYYSDDPAAKAILKDHIIQLLNELNKR